ncbi:hypothetical protein ACRCPY_32815, partial [Pseudomonas aeruginosa]
TGLLTSLLPWSIYDPSFEFLGLLRSPTTRCNRHAQRRSSAARTERSGVMVGCNFMLCRICLLLND